MRITKYWFLLIATAFIFGACEQESSNDTINYYSGSGSEGDLITFEINPTNNTYTVSNETTGQDDNGVYTVISSGALEGIYEVNDGANDFYAVELDDKIIAANFPTGNPMNNISFGVSSTLDNTANINNIAGDYTFIIMDNEGIMDDPYIKEWGILNVSNDGSWLVKSFATNTGDGSVPEMSPELYAGSFPLTSGDVGGTWTVNGTHKERLDVMVPGESDVLSGYVYASASEAAILLDLGTGNGFLIGLKVTNGESFNSIAGNYKFVNVWDNGKGAGNYSINDTGVVNWTHQGSDGPSSGSFQLTQCSNAFRNVFYCENAQLEQDYYEKIYCIIVGDIIVHFSFDNDNGNFAQYGIGARI